MLTVGIHVEKKVVSVKASVDPKATAAERAIMIVLSWLPMFLRDATLVSPKVGTLRTGTDRQTVLLDLALMGTMDTFGQIHIREAFAILAIFIGPRSDHSLPMSVTD